MGGKFAQFSNVPIYIRAYLPEPEIAVKAQRKMRLHGYGQGEVREGSYSRKVEEPSLQAEEERPILLRHGAI